MWNLDASGFYTARHRHEAYEDREVKVPLDDLMSATPFKRPWSAGPETATVEDPVDPTELTGRKGFADRGNKRIKEFGRLTRKAVLLHQPLMVDMDNKDGKLDNL